MGIRSGEVVRLATRQGLLRLPNRRPWGRTKAAPMGGDSGEQQRSSHHDAVRRTAQGWSPVGLIVAFMAGIGGWVLAGTVLADAGRPTQLAAGVGLFLLLYIPWLLFASGFAWRDIVSRFLIVSGVVLCCVALLRVDGLTGDLIPVLGWRWRAEVPSLGSDVSGELQVNASTTVSPRLETTPFDYPQFLGPARRATISNVRIRPDWGSAAPREIWRRPIGKGWSSLAVVGHRAVTQELRGDEELVVCYALETGEPIWAHRDRAPFISVIAGDGPRATPTIADGRVFTYGATGLLNCLDLRDGYRLWQVDVLEDNDAKLAQWGASCSPLVVDDLVIVSAGGAGGSALVAYEADTGKKVWSGGDDRAAYASPVLATLDGMRQVVTVNAASVAGHELNTGRVLWQHEWGGANNISQPVAVGNNAIFVSAGYGVGCTLLDIQRDAEGAYRVEERWSNKNLETKFTNVVVLDGHVIGLDNGILQCVEIATGQQTWKRGRYGHGQILLVDDLLLVQTESGDVALVRVSPAEARELGRFTAFAEKTWNNPALAGRYLLLRNDREMACYELAVDEIFSERDS